ncbi:MAG: circadian clock protein KaiC [Verrucomicrobiota bacterium]
MATRNRRPQPKSRGLTKTPTGIRGLDEVLDGGLPRGRSSLICGTAGCGKTLFGLEFLVRGATEFDEPGVFMAFEENEQELAQNVASLGFDLTALQARRKIVLDHVRIDRSEIEETGQYDLEGLFVRLQYAIDAIGAKRVVLDTLEALFASLPNEGILRAELRRLFRWLKDRKATAIITGERGEGSLTRHGLEEYVADCVILLDHRVINQITTRRLRVIKYRGSFHGTNEYPFLIARDGISVLPITSMGLDHPARTKRISSGVPRLDEMLSGKGYFCGSSILVSGTAGTGKTSLAAAFVQAACRRGERSLYFAFEESRDQIIRNAASIGIDLAKWAKKGLLHFHNVRPNLYGLEMHLLAIHDLVQEVKPLNVVIDPVSNLTNIGEQIEVRSMLTRLIDFFKTEEITTIFTSLTSSDAFPEQTDVGVSSLMDTWILLRNLEAGGERNRALYVLKARGMAHSNRVREFVLTNKGIELMDVYVHSDTVLTGAARRARQERDLMEASAPDRQNFASRRYGSRQSLVQPSQPGISRRNGKKQT